MRSNSLSSFGVSSVGMESFEDLSITSDLDAWVRDSHADEKEERQDFAQQLRKAFSENSESIVYSGTISSLPRFIGRLGNLKKLELFSCAKLTSLPSEIGDLHNLETLSLQDCRNLTALPPEIGRLHNLKRLSLRSCRQLTSLPAEIRGLRSLVYLCLSNCSNLASLPAEIGALHALKELLCGHCRQLTSLPPEIGDLRSLTILKFSECTRLTSLPAEVGRLQALTSLDLTWCQQLTSLPSEIGCLQNLITLDLSRCARLTSLPTEIGCLQNLEILSFLDCIRLVSLPSEIGDLTNLKQLYLTSCSSMSSLPSEIGNLSALEVLDLSGCWELISLPPEISNLSVLEELDLSEWTKLASLPGEIGRLDKLQALTLKGCESLTSLPTEIGRLHNLQTLDLNECLKLLSLPPEIGNLSALEVLDLRRCESLSSLPAEIGRLHSLQILDLNECLKLTSLPPEIGNLSALEELNLSNCEILTSLPAEIGRLHNLQILELKECLSLTSLPIEMGGLQNIIELSCDNCASLTTLPVNKILLSDFWRKEQKEFLDTFNKFLSLMRRFNGHEYVKDETFVIEGAPSCITHASGRFVKAFQDRLMARRHTKSRNLIYPGRLTHPNGDCYEGPILNGRAHGNGTVTTANGISYNREFRHGEVVNPVNKNRVQRPIVVRSVDSGAELASILDALLAKDVNKNPAESPAVVQVVNPAVVQAVDPGVKLALTVESLCKQPSPQSNRPVYSKEELVQLYKKNSELFIGYREEGVLIPELRFLWGASGLMNREELRALISNQAVRSEVNWVQLAKGWKTPLWHEFMEAGPSSDVLGLVVEYLRASKSHKLPVPIYKKIAELCLLDERILEPYRERGVLIPQLQWLWTENVSITQEESCALMMNPDRYRGIDWNRVVHLWSKETWLKLLAECGPVGFLKFFKECAQGRMRGVLSVEVEERLAQACQQAPACLDPYREGGVLNPELRHLWNNGVRMTRADVFALVDDPAIRRDIPAWPKIAKNWPEKWWAALLMERGLRCVLAVLNEQPGKEWKALHLVERRGLSIERGKLVSNQKDADEAGGSRSQEVGAKGFRVQGGEGSLIALDSRLDSVEVRPELIVNPAVVAQLKALMGAEADAVRIWIDNAAVGWYGNERQTVIEHRNKKWLHAHINVPGGALFVVGYQCDRTRAKCNVGWLMRGHNYEADLKHALPDDTEEDQVQWGAIREEVVKATERLASSTTPESGSSSASRANTPGDFGINLSSAAASETWGMINQEKGRDLLAALRGDQNAREPRTEADEQRLNLWEQRLGIGDPQATFFDRLEFLELWCEPLVFEWQTTVLGRNKKTDLKTGVRGTHIYRMQKIWNVSVEAVSRFFPDQQRQEPLEWAHLMALVEQMSNITDAWLLEDWAEEAAELLNIGLKKHAPLWRWMKIAKRLEPQLEELRLPKIEWPLKPTEILRIIQQKRPVGAEI